MNPRLPKRKIGVGHGPGAQACDELVAGVAVGGFIGWALDRLFGTAPLLMVVFLGLGAAAGIMNVVRTAKRCRRQRPLPGKDLPADDDDD